MAIVSLNAKNECIERNIVSIGRFDRSLAHFRGVPRHAILSRAFACVLAHSHPNGDPTPNAEDTPISRQMVNAGKVLEISVLDHIIIGHGRDVSLRKKGLVDFS